MSRQTTGEDASPLSAALGKEEMRKEKLQMRTKNKRY
jgi:hypothetical protein